MLAALAILLLALSGMWFAFSAHEGRDRHADATTGETSPIPGFRSSEINTNDPARQSVVAVSERRVTDDLTDPAADAPSLRAVAEPSAILRVVDEEGRPQAGVRVAIALVPAGELRPFSALGFWEGITEAPDGDVRVPWSELVRDHDQPDFHAEAFIRELVNSIVPKPFAFAPEPIPVVELVLPGTGRVVVVAPAVEDLELNSSGHATLQGRSRASANPLAIALMGWLHPSAAPFQDGVAVFERVGLDISLEVRATWVGLAADFHQVANGPMRAGEETRIVLETLEGKSCVAGRLVDERGNPKSLSWVKVRIASVEKYALDDEMRSLSTDDTGRFVVPIDTHDSIAEPRRLEFVARTEMPQSSERVLWGSIDPPGELRPGLIEVGNVVLAGPPVVVTGHVVDQHGKRVVGAVVQLVRPRLPVRRRLIDIEDMNAGGVDSGMALADGTGNFQMRSFVEGADIALSVEDPRFFGSDPTTVKRGALGVELVVRRPSSMSGRVLVDPCVPLSDVKLSLENQDSGDITMPAEDGTFRFEQLTPGRSRLSISIDGCDLPQLGLDDVVVDEANPKADSRLQQLDLRGSVRCLSIDVLDSQGHAVNGAQVWLSASAPTRFMRRRETVEGRAAFVFFPQPVDFDIECTGHKRIHLSSVESDQTVRLDAGPLVRFVIDGKLDLPPAPYRLSAGLDLTGTDPGEADQGSGAFESDGTCSFHVIDAGQHALHWYLVAPSGLQSLARMPGMTVVVRDIADEQVFHLELAPQVRKSWELEIERLKAKRDKL